MRTGLLIIFLYTAQFLFAQDRCATVAYQEQHLPLQTLPEARVVQPANNFLEKAAAQKAINEETVIRIPVVVHVLYHTATQNITDAQVRSGLEALNRDFRRKNADSVNTPKHFQPLAADVQIEFYLATADPLGRATNGIERKATTRQGWAADDKVKNITHGGLNAWDSRSYLNIWICNLIGGSGYATAPGSDAQTDGVVINYSHFGTLHTAAPFNMGRTAVHEVGHWLGLKHIWGDQPCGDDGVDDTPKQGFFTQGCPTGIRSSCSNGQAGDMYMNYMDYTNDACMNLFTLGQRQRMRAAFSEGGPRALLLQSKGLLEPWLAESPLPVSAAILYPNPANDKVSFQADVSQLGKTVNLVNSQGQVVRGERIESALHTVNVSELKPGVYFLKGEGFVHKFLKL